MWPSLAPAGAEAMSPRPGYLRRPRLSWPGAALVLAGHALLLAAVIQLGPALRLPTPEPIFLRLISETPAAEPAPPARATPMRPPPLPPVSVPETPVSETAMPVNLPASAVPPGLTLVTPAEPAPPSISQPRFDAAYLRNPAPAYPGLSRRAGEQGRVLLRVHVGADGRALEVNVQQSSGYPRLDDAAVNAVRQWQFEPARRGSDAVAAYVIVPIDFQLKPP